MAAMENEHAENGVNSAIVGLFRPIFSQPGVERADQMLMLGGYG